MKKRKWDIIVAIIIILLMGFIFLNFRMGQTNNREKAPIEVWFDYICDSGF